MEETSRSHSYVCVKKEHVGVIREKLKEIREKFSVSLREVPPPKTKTDCGTGSLGLSVLFFTVEKSGDATQIEVSQTAGRVQCFVDALCSGLGDHGDDSSYDSDQDGDVDADDKHQDVSRTASETLAAEYADYVTQGDAAVSRLEFGLRLGYTEPLVRAALRRLGPNPAQNELLAELIRQAAKTTRTPAPGQPGSENDVHPAPLASPPGPLRPRLRPVVVDGSNVAMSHGNKEVFSCRGLRLCVDWFRARGHTEITVFVPKWRKEAARPDHLVTEHSILGDLERERLLVYTPSRLVGGKRLVCYDDRYILRLAADTGGVVVSNDNYRDLAQENADFRRVVEERILMYSFVNDRFMPPDDPLGRSGPPLEQFLRMPAARADQPPPCPYAKKCTYGNKCKFSHPERGLLPHKSVTERLVEQAHKQLQAAGLARAQGQGKQLKGKSLSLPLDADSACGATSRKSPLTRSQSSVPSRGKAHVLGAPLQQSSQALLAKSYSVDSMLPPAAPAPSAAAGPGVGPGPGGGGAHGPGSPPATGDAAKLHRPLQRQLSLNPTFDPRLLQMRRAMGVSDAMAQPLAQPLAQPMVQPLAVGHSVVSRIASAPDSYQPWMPQQQHRLGAGPTSCGSEPQLNSAYEWNQALFTHQAQQVRQRLHYHLASIFPEELVATAMGLYPDEVDPQKICAAILGLQSKGNS